MILRQKQILVLAETKIVRHARELLPELEQHWPDAWSPLERSQRVAIVESLGRDAFRLGLGAPEFLRRFLHLACAEGLDFLNRPDQAWRRGIFEDLWMRPRDKLAMAGASLPLALLLEE